MKPTTIAFALAFLLTSILFSLLIFQLPSTTYTDPIGHNFLFGPALAVLLFSVFDRSFRFRSLSIRRFDYTPLLPLIVILAAVYIGENLLESALGFATFVPHLGNETYFGLDLPPLAWIPLFFLLLVIYTGFGEELSWRGYLFAKLQHLSWLQKVLVINLVFALWHLPLFIFPGPYQGSVFIKLPLFILACLELGTLLLYLRVRTASLIPCMLLHASATFIPNILNRFYTIDNTLWAGFPNVFVVGLLAPAAVWFYVRGKRLDRTTNDPGA